MRKYPSKKPQVLFNSKSEQEAHHLDDAKSQFLNKVSHELRTPLSVIKMYVESIEDGMYENNSEVFQHLKDKFNEFELLMDKMIKEEKTHKNK